MHHIEHHFSFKVEDARPLVERALSFYAARFGKLNVIHGGVRDLLDTVKHWKRSKCAQPFQIM